MTAFGAALYHDFSLVEDRRPYEALRDGILAGCEESSLQQFCVPVAPRKEAPVALRRDQLVKRIARGELASALVGTHPNVADDESVSVGIVLVPSTAAAQEGRAGYRYRLDVAIGGAAVERRGVAAVVELLVTFADAVTPRAGVVFPAETASYAHALATGAHGGLTEEQDKRVKDVFYAVYELGERIRGPEWGTFLGAHHVAKLGGIEAIERIAKGTECAVMRRLAAGGAYLQTTARLDDPALEVRVAALAAALEPVR